VKFFYFGILKQKVARNPNPFLHLTVSNFSRKRNLFLRKSFQILRFHHEIVISHHDNHKLNAAELMDFEIQYFALFNQQVDSWNSLL